MDFTKFKDIFGKPNEGIHKYKIGGIAAVDLGLTLGAAYFISSTNWIPAFIILLILSIFVHLLFGVDTTLIKMIFNTYSNESKIGG